MGVSTHINEIDARILHFSFRFQRPNRHPIYPHAKIHPRFPPPVLALHGCNIHVYPPHIEADVCKVELCKLCVDVVEYGV